ncbi:4'-phosphopantetheinyl transferase family protein [Cellulomonas oligotrophica]|uniref:4'-phosphopantetheinyl transferase n=1 Tax=Cellulomonas oligotrophica TaxID=931536 RepID=A0A7Y9FFW3_9CELL|nr:4'-phosphopantetheinyl transferase superfamily protein [Cellulomonas oligotrophica]NYD86560.1 4'-phosphopantetheinyl transferase [Cellulomonas oligotrophica]GIG32550.1 hypothetical protein Col01nite_17090 [Cellulomonas oligotrophica]
MTATVWVATAGRAQARAVLHGVLARVLGVPADEVVLDREPCVGCGGPHGRPVLGGGRDDVHFSLSSGGGLVLVAVADVRVGVDVEAVPEAARARAVAGVLHPRERARLARVPEADHPAALARAWVRTEAYLKGLGTGLQRDPAADDLDDPAGAPRGWTIHDVPVGPDARAAVALRDPGARPPAITRWSPEGTGEPVVRGVRPGPGPTDDGVADGGGDEAGGPVGRGRRSVDG